MEALKIWLKKCVRKSKHEAFLNAVDSDISIEENINEQVAIISEIHKVKFTLKTPSGENVIKAVVKDETSSDVGKSLAENWHVFENEIMMYSEVLIKMEDLLKKNGYKQYPWAECYYCGEGRLLFQDLYDVGCRIVPLYKLLDYDHIMLVMKDIGMFHALSMIMEERKMLDHSKLRPSFLGEKSPFLVNVIKVTYGNIVKTMKSHWGQEWSAAAEGFAKLAEDPAESLHTMVKNAKGNWNVLNHGDFSMRNLMFHYPEGSSQPDGVKFLDFQMIHYNSLGFDLVNILYSSVLPKIRDENMDKFLETYLESLNAICREYEFEGRVPSIDDIKSCLKSLSYFSTMCSFTNIPLFLSSDQRQLQEETDNFVGQFGIEECSGNQMEIATGYGGDMYDRKDIKEIVMYEIKRLLKEKII